MHNAGINVRNAGINVRKVMGELRAELQSTATALRPNTNLQLTTHEPECLLERIAVSRPEVYLAVGRRYFSQGW